MKYWKRHNNNVMTMKLQFRNNFLPNTCYYRELSRNNAEEIISGYKKIRNYYNYKLYSFAEKNCKI
jgi:hypothetical protein